VLLGEARRLAPNAPRGQKRILSIKRPLVYRVRHGRWRGATWLEANAARFWLCAGAQREEGSGEDAYEPLRDVLFGLALTAAGAELWEPRADWPSGELAWFEVSRLGLRESWTRLEATPPSR
jgi:hypothetical protein